MSGTLEAEIVAVRHTARAGGHFYLEAYESESLFWESLEEGCLPCRVYRLRGDQLVEWDYRDALAEREADAWADRRHREAVRVA